MSDLDLPPVERLQAVKLEPGDTLVATVPREANITPDQVDEIKAALEAEFPGVEVLVVVGVQLTVGRMDTKEQT